VSRLGKALSALMRWPRKKRPVAALEAMDQIRKSKETPARKRLLCECVQAYAPLEDEQRIEVDSLLDKPKWAGVKAMFKTWSEEGEEKGRRETLLEQLEVKFAPLSETVRRRLTAWPAEKLPELGRALLKAQSLRELGLED
jgi:hypothetical protein